MSGTDVCNTKVLCMKKENVFFITLLNMENYFRMDLRASCKSEKRDDCEKTRLANYTMLSVAEG